MRYTLAPALVLTLSAISGLASPVITSVTPNAGPVAGGTAVTIKGSGFIDPCAPPKACPVHAPNVSFGADLEASSTLIDSQTLVVTTAAHLPGKVTVSVCQPDGCAHLSDAFTFVGDAGEAFDRILLPVFMPPSQGSFGSVFVTVFDIWNKTDGPPIAVYGVPPLCPPITCVPVDPETPLPLYHESSTTEIQPAGGTPGLLLYVPKDRSSSVAVNLRVADQSRVASTLGAEIPVARESDFQDRIALLNVPIGPAYRALMRIYSATPAETDVSVRDGSQTFVVHLNAGPDLFHPATGTFSAFPPPPPDGRTILTRVTVEPLSAGTRIWAFISLTNNDTQQITIVSPQ